MHEEKKNSQAGSKPLTICRIWSLSMQGSTSAPLLPDLIVLITSANPYMSMSILIPTPNQNVPSQNPNSHILEFPTWGERQCWTRKGNCHKSHTSEETSLESTAPMAQRSRFSKMRLLPGLSTYKSDSSIYTAALISWTHHTRLQQWTMNCKSAHSKPLSLWNHIEIQWPHQNCTFVIVFCRVKKSASLLDEYWTLGAGFWFFWTMNLHKL